MGGKKRIAIITPAFTEFPSGFSLTGIVKDQLVMLKRHGHDVSVFVCEMYSPELFDDPCLVKKIPFARLIDYSNVSDFGNIQPDDFTEAHLLEHKECPAKMAEMLLTEIPAYDIVFTHDIVFTGWNLPYYLGLREIASKPEANKVRWLHWVHSVPTHGFNWWNIEALGRYHKIVFPNRSDRQLVAEAYRGRWEDVRTIPHIKDIRILNRFLPESWEFIDRYPALLSADVVQIYPASVDRLGHKRVRETLLIFKEIKKLGFKVCLVIANQWATGRQQKEDVSVYKEMALNNGLTMNEFIFTSEFKPEWEVGVPHDVLVDLFHCSNLFIFPTAQESFGLVLPEALMSGGCLPVINRDAEVLSEMLHNRGLRFGFGSLRNTIHFNEEAGGEAGYLAAIAGVIVQRMFDEEGIAARSICRQSLNMDYLYSTVYHPIFEESAAW